MAGRDLPLLPINHVVLPGGFLRLSVGKPRSVRLVEGSLWGPFGQREFVVSTDGNGSRMPVEGGEGIDDAQPSVTRMVCVVCVEQLTRATSSQGFEFSMLVRGLCRARIDGLLEASPFYRVRVTRIHDPPPIRGASVDDVSEAGKLASALRDAASTFLSMLKAEGGSRSNGFLSRRTFQALEEAPAGALADAIASMLPGVSVEKLQEILESEDVAKRLLLVTDLLKQKMGEFEASQLIKNRVNDDLAAKQREFYLRRQLKAIQKELRASAGGGGGGADDDDDDDGNEMAKLESAIHEAQLPAVVQDVAMRNLKRLKKMSTTSPEHQGLRTYLETLADLPWNLNRPPASSDPRTPTDPSKAKSMGADVVVEERSVESGDDHVERGEVSAELGEGTATSAQYPNVEDMPQSNLRRVDIETTRTQLDEDHFGLERVKRRIIEYVAVRKLKNDLSGPILCLVGPPGVGKTSLGKSIARSLNRTFTRLALGGVHDEAEIRGHRRTYVGAMPGTVIQSIRRARCRDPVILLDEVDKLGGGFGVRRSGSGDPASALLEVLDPEQNHSFVDHYIDVPFDLSAAIFIATANSVASIPPPLLDRMEVIELPGYTVLEKVNIAARYLVPRQLAAHGMREEHLLIPHDTISDLVQGYTREAGVRQLEQRIAGLCRFVAVRLVEHEKRASDGQVAETFMQVVMDSDIANDILGAVRYEHETVDRTAGPGVGTGLAWTPTGGELLFIECSLSPGTGSIQLTGQLGDVMRESAKLALSWLRANSSELLSIVEFAPKTPPTQPPPNDALSNESSMGGEPRLTFAVDSLTDLHLHVPAGATPKDGPSAGVAIVATLFSLFTKRSIDPFTAMTGEITLRGRILPVGGIRDKVLAASRGGIKTVVLPRRNERDLAEIPDEVLGSMRFVFVESLMDVFYELFPSRNAKKKIDRTFMPRLEASL